MKRFLLLIAFVFFAAYSFGQSPQIDSIKHAIRISVDRKAKLGAMLRLCEMFAALTAYVQTKLLHAQWQKLPLQVQTGNYCAATNLANLL